MKKDTLSAPLLRWYRLATHLRRFWFADALVVLVVIFLANRLWQLTRLPVFADEAIYIYWSQLAASDWSRYAFYPLLDGKTPLVIWLLIPLVRVWRDPLVAGRLLSVLFGLGQLWLTVKLVAFFTPKRRYQLLAGLLVILSPGLMLNNRLALLDTAATFFVTLCFWAALGATRLQLANTRIRALQGRNIWWRWTLLAGVGFGLALWTKFSCLLILPLLATVPLYHLPLSRLWRRDHSGQTARRELVRMLLPLGTIVIIGVGFFATLKVAPTFSQIFSRGGDFLYSLPEWREHAFTILAANTVFFGRVLANYAGVLLFGSSVVLSLALAWERRRFEPLLLLISALAFAAPILLFGHVVYPRYFLPVIPLVIASFTLALANLRRLSFVNFKIAVLFLVALTGIYWSWGLHFAPQRVQLLAEDRVQLLDEWSAGYGIRETVAEIEALAQTGTVLVLSEGHVGTLPDGLQIYLWHSPWRDRVRIEGLGAPPVRNLGEHASLIPEYDHVLVVANSHRLELDDGVDIGELWREYHRPDRKAPTLQVWRLK